MQQRILRVKKNIFGTNLFRNYYTFVTSFISKRPFVSFFVALVLLFSTIILGNFLTRPKLIVPESLKPKIISAYNIGETPKVVFQAKIDKTGVVKIIALAGGVMQYIAVSEGDKVWQGEQLFSLSTNYSGGNTLALSSQIADAQYKNVQDTYNEQKDAIQKQRDIANSTHDNFSDMQKIATQSANDTNNLISANQTILDALNQQLATDKQNNASQSALIPEESQINQLQAGQNQLQVALSNLQEQTDSGKPAGRLADAQHDLTMEQLDLQEKSLAINMEVSKLQANIADVTAATMFPTSPFGGIVERVYVHVGQFVSPGTVLAEISATNSDASIVVDVPENIVKNISPLEPSVLSISDKLYTIRPVFVPTEPTNGSLFTITYALPKTVIDNVSDGQYVSISIPIGSVNTSAAIPFVPLDSVYQTQDTSYVLIDNNGKAKAQQVVVGDVFGDYVQVKSGLFSGDTVILNRNVLAGDLVKLN